MEILDFLQEYSGLATLVSIMAGGLWAVLKFRETIKDKRFQTYHDLVDQLVNEQREPTLKIKLDRQIAIVYELRNFINYYPVTKRMLRDLREQWKDEPRICKEIDLTLEFISSNWFQRSWCRFFKTK